ncbi:OLC1v1013535C1 [Oldenlandia corymbosa var. corymbosa]|uniref:OLC1v1013535C1 n=1 Tax=Oldenlandia corymbosa var. corymbosa TaxID=529605 RepID=A0AAV1DZB9_OLDCO|nr:OLC1v1013535C1 [Oldenlandia corymbosa var. corymbosa]
MKKFDILALVAAEAYQEEVKKKSTENIAARRPIAANWGCTSKRTEFRHPRRKPKMVSSPNNDPLLPEISGLESEPGKVGSLKFRINSNKKIQTVNNGRKDDIIPDNVSGKYKKDTGKTEKTGVNPNFMAFIPSLDLPFKKRKRWEENCPDLPLTKIPTLDMNKTPKIRIQKKCKHSGPDPAPDLPVEFKKKILERAGYREVESEVLVIQKRLTKTDVKGQQNRFSIPANQVKGFPDKEDKEFLKQRDKDGHCKAIPVGIIEPQDKVQTVNLRRWEMKKTKGGPSIVYVLNGDGWKNIRDGNKLRVGNLVQLWRVKIEGRLCLIFVKVEEN